MVKVDPNADLYPEGLHLFEITSCEEGRKKKDGTGALRFYMSFQNVYDNTRHYEQWMVEGGGLGMTVRKFKALGLDLSKDVEPYMLKGLRFIGKIKHKHSDDYGDQAQLGGVWLEENAPAEWIAQQPGSPDLYDGKDEHGKPLPAEAKADPKPSDDVPF